MTTDATQHPTIAMDAVESTQIEAIGHHAETNTLAIRFPRRGGKPGSVYHYDNFTADDFKAFKEAESKGSHFGQNIKKNTEKYPYTKVS